MVKYTKITRFMALIALIGCFIPSQGLASHKRCKPVCKQICKPVCGNKPAQTKRNPQELANIARNLQAMRNGNICYQPKPNLAGHMENEIPGIISTLQNQFGTLTYPQAQNLYQRGMTLITSYKRTNPPLGRGWEDRLNAAFTPYAQQQRTVVPAPVEPVVPPVVPAPVVVPRPVPAPIIVPEPVIIPQPVPTPIIVPAPVPAPVEPVVVEPTPVIPVPVIVPQPVPAPIVVPAPVEPVVVDPAPVIPAPIVVPEPVIIPQPVPAPVEPVVVEPQQGGWMNSYILPAAGVIGAGALGLGSYALHYWLNSQNAVVPNNPAPQNNQDQNQGPVEAPRSPAGREEPAQGPIVITTVPVSGNQNQEPTVPQSPSRTQEPTQGPVVVVTTVPVSGNNVPGNSASETRLVSNDDERDGQAGQSNNGQIQTGNSDDVAVVLPSDENQMPLGGNHRIQNESDDENGAIVVGQQDDENGVEVDDNAIRQDNNHEYNDLVIHDQLEEIRRRLIRAETSLDHSFNMISNQLMNIIEAAENNVPSLDDQGNAQFDDQGNALLNEDYVSRIISFNSNVLNQFLTESVESLHDYIQEQICDFIRGDTGEVIRDGQEPYAELIADIKDRALNLMQQHQELVLNTTARFVRAINTSYARYDLTALREQLQQSAKQTSRRLKCIQSFMRTNHLITEAQRKKLVNKVNEVFKVTA